ncbi:hypothetical protein RhiirB3_501014, partial [Rhizophagus irregularis]
FRYIYGGILSLNEQDTSDILKILAAADELCLQELIDYLQGYLIENKSEWIEQNFELTHRISFQSNNLLEIQQFCTNLMAKSPEIIFDSFDFTSLPETSLIKLIERDDLQMKEVEVWDRVLEWGLAQNSTLISDPDTWTDDDYRMMENTLQRCLPLIRFFSLSSKEFLQNIDPYKKLLNSQLYKDLLNSYMNPDSIPNDNISLPRNIHIDEVIDSTIVSLNIVSIISRWIDKVDVNRKFSYLRELYLPYKFKLLLRGSRDGFTAKQFHTLCDDKLITVTFIKIEGAEEIIGGYNPLTWSTSNNWIKTKDSFIFSFKSNFKTAIISNVKNINCAMANHPRNGPCFNRDLAIGSLNENENFCKFFCINTSYEKKIRDQEGKFSMEDYEIFQIVKN